jgi:hypothetical protein
MRFRLVTLLREESDERSRRIATEVANLVRFLVADNAEFGKELFELAIAKRNVRRHRRAGSLTNPSTSRCPPGFNDSFS